MQYWLPLVFWRGAVCQNYQQVGPGLLGFIPEFLPRKFREVGVYRPDEGGNERKKHQGQGADDT